MHPLSRHPAMREAAILMNHSRSQTGALNQDLPAAGMRSPVAATG